MSVTIAGDGHALDGTVTAVAVTNTSTVKKRNFHTGLDPVSRTNNSAQPTEFNGGVTVTVTNPDDATIVTSNAENKIVIPAGRRNPDARTARQIGVGSGTANDGGDGTVTPAAGDVADGTVAQPTTIPSPRATTVTTVSATHDHTVTTLT